jgi:hypothetical protein
LVDVRHPAAELVVWGDQQIGYVELDWECEIESERPIDPMEAASE